MTNLFEQEVAKARLMGDANGQLSLCLLGGGRAGRRNQGDPPLTRYGEATVEPAPWQSMQAYDIECSDDLESLNRAVTKLNGALYYSANGVIVVIPSGGGLDRLREILKAEGGGTSLWGRALGPP